MSHPQNNNNMNDSESMHFQMAHNQHMQQQQQHAVAPSVTGAAAGGAPNTVKLSKIIACEIKVGVSLSLLPILLGCE